MPKNGEPWMDTRWLTDPPDGFRCLVATRRTLDVNGHCCDYERCSSTNKVRSYRGIDRCMLNPDHEGLHHGETGRKW